MGVVVWIVVTILVLAVLVATGLAIAIAFNSPRRPSPLRSVVDGLARIKTSLGSLPERSSFDARDGQRLAYRVYPGSPGRVVVMVHGSGVSGDSMHPLAAALSAEGITVYALDMRGHGGTGVRGDLAHIGQLDDDIADFLGQLPSRAPGARRLLLGFSAGGGLVLRFAAGPHKDLVDGYVLLTPFLGPTAPTLRPESVWAAPPLPRVIALSLLNSLGLTIWNGLPAVAFALAPEQIADPSFAPDYTFRMLSSFGPHMDWAGDLRAVSRPMRVLIGDNDEIFDAAKMGPAIQAIRPDIPVAVVPGPDHVGLVASAAGQQASVAAVTALAPA